MADFEILLGDRQVQLSSDFEKAIPPWDGAIATIASPVLRTAAISVQQEIGLQIVESIYQIIAHWVYKKRWHTRHKMPAKKRVCDAVEPLADLVLVYCNLCIELHAIGRGPEYPNAVAWLAAIVTEMQRDTFSGFFRKKTKADLIAETRDAIRQLRDEENPIDPEHSPNLHRLLSRTIEVIKQGAAPTIFDPLWKGRQKQIGLIPALTAYCKFLESSTTELWMIVPEDLKILAAARARDRPKTILDFSPVVE